MKSLADLVKDYENQKRKLEETVDLLNEENAKLKVQGKVSVYRLQKFIKASSNNVTNTLSVLWGQTDIDRVGPFGLLYEWHCPASKLGTFQTHA